MPSRSAQTVKPNEYARRRRRDRAQRGIILFAALSALALLSLIASGLIATSRSDRLLARNFLSATKNQLITQSAIAQATAGLLSRAPGANAWTLNGTPRTIIVDGVAVEVSIQAEAGKIDINEAPEELLASLFEELGFDQAKAAAIAGAIADWRDADDEKRLNGAESADYQKAGLSYGPYNRKIESLAELKLLLGIADAKGMRNNYLTTHSQTASIDISLADPSFRKMKGATANAAYIEDSNIQMMVSGQSFSISITTKLYSAPITTNHIVRVMHGIYQMTP